MLNKTLEQLDGQNWGEPNFPSHLVTECHRLRRVPLQDFTVENLRILIGQHIGLDFLVPLALMRLFDEPFVSGDFFDGDLLLQVLRLTDDFWNGHPDLRLSRDIVVGQATLVLSLDKVLAEDVYDYPEFARLLKKYQAK